MLNNKFHPAAILLTFLLTLCIWCSGCSRKEQDDLEPLKLEESKDTQVSNGEEPGTTGNDQLEEESESPSSIFVYVCGAVNTPGVYELKSDARIYEAIACAGGVREDAAEESINQAQAISDGERLYIPTDEEVRQGMDAYLQSGIAGGGTDAVQHGTASGMYSDGTGGSNANGKVNINTASREELKTLNGIGDTRQKALYLIGSPTEVLEAWKT